MDVAPNLRRQGLERLLDLPPVVLSLWCSLLLPLPQTLLVSAIATAELGPGLGLIALALIGAGNVMITAGLSEAIVRLGEDSKGRTTLPAVADFYLGPIGRRVATFAILTMWFTALVGGQIGFIDVMAGLTGTPQIPWLLGLTVLIIGLNRRRSLGFSSMLLLSLLTFLLLAGISLDLIPRMNPVSLASFWVPLAQVDPWQLPNWSSLLAISFYTYFGPSLLAPTASFVLQQDRTGRSMIRGSIAGSLGLIGVVMVWLGLISRALPRQNLLTMKGTVLVALGNTGGTLLPWLCAALAITLSGFSAIRAGGVLGNQLRDLPVAQSSWGQKLVPALPTLLSLILILVWMHSGATNLTTALSIGGGLGIPIGCWIIPSMIMRQARRMKPGPVPSSWPLAGHPWITFGLITIGLLILLFFGLLAWSWWPIKFLAVGLAVGLTLWNLRLQPVNRA